MRTRWWHASWLAVVVLAAGLLYASTDPYKDPLDTPALPTKLLQSSQLSAVTRAGDRLVAVGARGLITVSDDGGENWSQRQAPVSSDLLAVHFPSAKDGWVVGHDGVVLHTADGAATWTKQLDGLETRKLLTEHFQRRVEEGDPDAARFLKEVEFSYANGPEQALLGVWFEDPLRGFVCGSFGTLLATRDGGKTWESWLEKVVAPAPVHLNGISGIAGGVFIASEKGVVFRLDRKQQKFLPTQTGYAGSFFGVTAAGESVVAFGLRGTAYRTSNGGGQWNKLETGVVSSLTAGTDLTDGRVMLVTQSGQAIAGDERDHFRPIAVARPTLFSGVAPAGPSGAVVLVGLGGVTRLQFNGTADQQPR